MPKTPIGRSEWISRTCCSVAGQQHGAVARRQLIGLGISRGCISNRVGAGLLIPVARAVYLVGSGRASRQTLWMIGVLAAGDRAALAGRSAAVLHGFLDHDGVIDVRRPDSRRRQDTRIRTPDGRSTALHIRRRREARQVPTTSVEGIPVVSVGVALLDLAETLPTKKLRSTFIEADRLGLITSDDAEWLAQPRPGHKGAKDLRKLVLARNPEIRKTSSVLEELFRQLCADFGLPAPLVNHPTDGYRADFLWPEQGLIVEVDGAAFHKGTLKHDDDRRRENELVAAGKSVLRFTWAQVEDESEDVMRQVESGLRSRHPGD